MTKDKLKTIDRVEITPEIINRHLSGYKYQEDLTEEPDKLDTDFDQNIINEIVLWKVNRYVELDNEALNLLNEIKKADKTLNVELTKKILLKLLGMHGIRLAMASTILRFKNPNIYQIIDQRVYRFIYPDKNLTTLTNNKEKQIEVYLQYLLDLRLICHNYDIPFYLSDRIIYSLDKTINKSCKIK